MKEKIKFLVKLLLIIIAIFFNFEFLYKDEMTLASLNAFNYSLIVFLIIAFIKRNRIKRIKKEQIILSVLFDIFMIIGEITYITGDLFNLFKFSFFILGVIKAIGYYFAFNTIIELINYWFENVKFKEIWKRKTIFNWYFRLLNKYPFRTSLITIFCFFSIYLIAFYPIVLSPDPSYQIKMYFNVHTKYIDWVIQRNPLINMTNHHPIVHSYLLGGCLSLGRKLVNDNFGLFIYTLLQTICYGSALAYSIKFMGKNKISPKYSAIVVLLYCLMPMYGFYTVSAVKDTYYTCFMILFVLFLFDFIKNYKDKPLKNCKCLLLLVDILLLSLFRQNGIYVVYLTMPFVILYSKKNWKKLSSVFGLFIIFMWGFNNLFIPAIGVSDGSIREALSVPFQQTARLVKYHDDIIDEEDKIVIDKILTYDTLAERYNPTLADKVKNEYNKYTTSEELKDYFKVWFKYLLKEPGCYINATLNNTYGYFYPVSHNWYFYHRYDTRITQDDLVDYHYNGLSFLRNFLVKYGTIMPDIPVIGLLSTIGIGLFVVLYLINYAIIKNKKKYIIVLLPLIISILVCFVGPANTYFRYAMPYLFVLPVLIGLFVKEMRNNYE